MSKAHRGSGIRKLPMAGRGLCPVCKRSKVKVLYEQEINGKKLAICKQCRAALSHNKKQDILATL